MDDTYYIPVNQAKPIADILTHLSTVVSQQRIRLKEPFQDFDRLNSHYVTRTQFLQVLKGIRLQHVSDQSLDQLADAYAEGSSGDRTSFTGLGTTTSRANHSSSKPLPAHQQRVNWYNFVRDVEMGGESQINLEKKPRDQETDLTSTQRLKQRNADFFQRRRQNTLTEQEMQQFRTMMQRLRHVCRERGIIAKQLFIDHDKLNRGTVTKSQFIQSLPFADLDMQQLQLLVKRYENTEGLIDYLVFHLELMGNEPVGQLKFEGEETRQVKAPQGTDPHFFAYEAAKSRRSHNTAPHSTLADITEDKLKELVLKHRIRLEEGFRDFDPLRKGAITVPQFKSVIGNIKFPKYQFSSQELNALSDKYLHVDDLGKETVRYQDLVDNIFRIFTEKNLEKRPTASINSPTHLLRTSKPRLSHDEEQHIEGMLDRVRHIVKTRRLLMKYDFMDFDRSNKNTNSCYVSPTRFERALDNLGLHFTPQEYALLARKYDDLNNGDVNYRLFLQDIDQEVSESSDGPAVLLYAKKVKPRDLPDLQALMQKIQHLVVKHRVRLGEFLTDFDPLRANRIHNHKFRAGMSQAGIELTDHEYQMLIDAYADTQLGFIRYGDFLQDVDSVSHVRNLEKQPTAENADVNGFLSTRSFRKPSSVADSQDLNDLLQRLSHFVKTHGVFMKPTFQAYDTFRRGKITSSQFRQCVDKVLPNITKKEYKLLEKCYYNPEEDYVMYLEFIGDVDPRETDTGAVVHDSENNNGFTLSRRNGSRSNKNRDNSEDLNTVLEEVRSQAKRSRIRMRDNFLDFDPLRKGFVTENKFRSVLSTSKLVLTKPQVDLIVNNYRHTQSNLPGSVDYVAFMDAVDEIFTPMGLEGQPLADVQDYQPKDRFSRTYTQFEKKDHDELFRKTYDKIVQLVRTRRIHLVPFFQDYDKQRKQRVTKTQFSSVLSVLQLNLSPRQLKVLSRYYEDIRGDVDYNSFCQDVERDASGEKNNRGIF